MKIDDARVAMGWVSIERLTIGMLAVFGLLFSAGILADDSVASGLVGDGKTLNTATLVALMGSGGNSVVIPAGDYRIGKLSIPANTKLTLRPGVILRDSGQLALREQLITIAADNVQIVGTGAKVISNPDDYRTGEQRHGIFINGAHNISIVGLESSGHGGDGFCIGGTHGTPASDVVLDHVLANHNRRQGLSIFSARNVQVTDSTFVNTKGTKPEFGVDIEPDHPTDVIQNINIQGVHTGGNEGGGILIHLPRLDASSEAVSINVTHHFSEGDHVGLELDKSATAKGLVQYSKAKIVNSKLSGIIATDPYAEGVRLEFSDVTITDSNSSGGVDPAVSSAVVFAQRPSSRTHQGFGNIVLDHITVTATGHGNKSPYAFWIQEPRSGTDPWNGLSVRGLAVSGVPVISR